MFGIRLFLLSTIVSLSFFAQSSFAGVYDQEIGLIEANHRAILEKATDTVEKSGKFRRIWSQVGIEFRVLNQNLSAFAVKTPRSSDPKINFYNDLIHEQMFSVRGVAEFQMARAKIKEKIERSITLVSQANWLRSYHENLVTKTNAKLDFLEQQLQKRKLQAAKNLELWNQRQLRTWQAEQGRIGHALSQGIAVDQMIARLPLVFLRMNNRARLALIMSRKDEARDVLDAEAWFRSVIPVYFTDKVLSVSAQSILKDLLATSESTERALRDQLGTSGAHAYFPTTIGLKRTLAEEGEGNDPDPDAPQSEKDWGDNSAGVDLVPPDGSRFITPYNLEYYNNRDFAERSAPDAKVVNGYEGSETVAGQGRGNSGTGTGAVSSEQGVERVTSGQVIEKARIEFHDEMVAHLERIDHFIFSLSHPGESEGGTSDPSVHGSDPTLHSAHLTTGERVSELLDRSESSVNRNNREDFKRLRDATDALKKTSELYEKVITDERASIDRANNEVVGQGNLLDGTVGSVPETPNLDSVFPSVVSSEQIDLSWSGLRSALSSPSTALLNDMGGFIAQSSSAFGPANFLASGIVLDAMDGVSGLPANRTSFYQSGTGTVAERVAGYKLGKIDAYVNQRAQSGQRITAIERNAITEELSRIVQALGIKPFDVIGGAVSGGGGLGIINIPAQIRSILETVARVSISLTPVGTVIDIHNLMTGKDFFTGQALTPAELALTAMGVMLGQGMTFREAVAGYREANALRQETRVAIERAERTITEEAVISAERNGPMKPGRMSEIVVGDPADGITVDKTFRSQSYTTVTRNQSRTLYRVQSQEYVPGQPLKSYWTEVKPNGPGPATWDLALHPNYNNSATHWLEIEVPPGITTYDGAAAPQAHYLGGGSQVYIEHVDPSWFRGQGSF